MLGVQSWRGTLSPSKKAQLIKMKRRAHSLQRICKVVLMRTVYPKLLALLFCMFQPSDAHARCQGAIMLGRFHDAYLAALTETGETQISGARTLLVLVGGKNSNSLERQLQKTGLQISEDALSRVMRQGAELAHGLLIGAPPPSDSFPHSRNIDWLAKIVHRADCQDGIANRTVNGVLSRRQETRAWKPSKDIQVETVSFGLAGMAAFLSMLFFGIRKLRTSRAFRVRQAERLPRRPFSMQFLLTITDQAGDIQQTKASGVDLSAGGMKLEWRDAPPTGTTVTVSMPFGERLASVVWSNAYYAGIVFDDTLSNSQLTALINEAAKTGTAPKGAALKS